MTNESRQWFGIGVLPLADGFTALGISLEFDDEFGVEFYIVLIKFMFWISVGSSGSLPRMLEDDEE